VDVVTRGGSLVLSPKGDLTIFEAVEFREALLVLHEKEGPVELDLSQVKRMDSSGVQLVVAACRGGWVRITGMTPAIRTKFQTVGCEPLIHYVRGSSEAWSMTRFCG